MRHCRLLLHTLILGCILGKDCLAISLHGRDLAGRDPLGRRTLLQSDNASVSALLEYNPAFDAAAELQALTALYEATGGTRWTYASLSEDSSAASSGSSGNASANDSLTQRFQRRKWLDKSVSYCQW